MDYRYYEDEGFDYLDYEYDDSNEDLSFMDFDDLIFSYSEFDGEIFSNSSFDDVDEQDYIYVMGEEYDMGD